MNFTDELFLVADSFERNGITYALCGGVAVVIHGYPRVTRDIDLLIEEQDLDRARRALEASGYTLTSGLIPFDFGTPTERQVFRVTKVVGEEHLTVDLVLVSPYLDDVWKDRETRDVEGRVLRVVSLAGLAKMKRAAGPPQAFADLAQLGLEPNR